MYWCGDDCFRGCILRGIFSRRYHVLIPSQPPNKGTGRLAKKGATYPLAKISKIASARGCRELEVIDREWGVSPRGLGDIDFAAQLTGSRVFIAEVKTRIIPRTLSTRKSNGAEILRLMLQYHLDEPSRAVEAWKKLIEKKVVNYRPRSRSRGYDNPASVAELVRACIGFTYKYGESYDSIVIGAITYCAANPLISDMLEYVRNSSQYLANCGLSIEGYCILVVSIESFSADHPSLTLVCYGNACHYLAPLLGTKYSLDELLGLYTCYRGCSTCPYRRVCESNCKSQA